MKWIKYQVVQCIIGEETVLINKKVGYNDKNLAIAQTEAYNGYQIIEDGESFDKEPIAIEFGGTGAKTAEAARNNIGAAAKSQIKVLTVASAAWSGTKAPFIATIACDGVTANNNIIVGAGGALTAEQQAAMAAAMIVCTAQATGTITLTAYGAAPKIDLPVNVMIAG